VKDFRRDLFKLGALLVKEYDLLGLEDLNVLGLIQSETKKRGLRLYNSSFSELRRILEWEFAKQGKTVLLVSSVQLVARVLSLLWNQSRPDLGGQSFPLSILRFHSLDRDLNASLILPKRAGWEPPVVAWKASPTTSLGLKRTQGGAMIQEASAFRQR